MSYLFYTSHKINVNFVPRIYHRSMMKLAPHLCPIDKMILNCYPNKMILRPKYLFSILQCPRYKSTYKEGFMKRTWESTKWTLFLKRHVEDRSRVLYTKIGPNIEMKKFFEICSLPDTFYSWYLVTELHVWMVSVRLMAVGKEGVTARNIIIKSLYLEVDERSKLLENINLKARREDVRETVEHLLGAFFSYDEALDGDDKVLAAALWRNLFNKECEDPTILEALINYVRRNLVHLETIKFGELLYDYKVSFVPFLEPKHFSTQ